jgi:hypothetical protein
MSNNIDDGYSAAGLIKRIDEACEEINYYTEMAAGRKVSYEDGVCLINSLFFAKRDIEEAIDKLDDVLTDDAVVH